MKSGKTMRRIDNMQTEKSYKEERKMLKRKIRENDL
jgi:hypothetical protein